MRIVSQPRGPAPVTKNPLALLRYMRKMRRGAGEVVGQRFERYGDLYYAPFLGRDVYVLRHPDHIKEVLVTRAASFGKPRSGMTAGQLGRLLGEGLLNANGDSWRRRRRLIQPAFRPARLRRYMEMVDAFTAERLAGWRDGSEVDVSREMMELTLRIVSKALFDHEVSGDADRVAVAMDAFRMSFGGIEAVLPDWLPVPAKRRVLDARDTIDAIVYGLIDGHDGSEGDDLLSALLASRDADRLRRQELRDELLTLFIAGHETTSHALSWTFHLLGQNPDVRARLRREIDIEGSTYPRQVLEESMRLYPPAYAIARESTEPTEIGGWPVVAGADAVIWIHHVHRDARWFPDPERFDPDRFDAERRKSLPQCAYLPFGAGQRTCIGKQFALMEAERILVAVARDWTLEPVPGHRVEPHLSVTMAPKGGLPMRARRN